MEHIIAQRGGFEISTDPVRLDLDLVCGVLAKTYWAEGIARDAIEESIRNALAFGLYGGEGAQVGFARVVTDGVRMAYLSDLFILEELQGRGLGKWLMESIFAYEGLGEVLRWFLNTRDAQDFYYPLGFKDILPGQMMVRAAPGVAD
jgi:GNAT superfamily N-acetyltransferase